MNWRSRSPGARGAYTPPPPPGWPSPSAKASPPPQGKREFADGEAIDAAIHAHCVEGGGVVRQLDLGEEAALAVESHHERWDGEGYPDGVAEEEIPIEARH